MIDILVLFFIGRHIATIAQRKNRSAVGYVLLLVFSYYGGAIFGMIVCGLGAEAAGIHDDFIMMFAIGGFVIGLLLGIGLAYLVVLSVSPLPRNRDYEDDYDDRPRRRLYGDDDDWDRPRPRYEDDDRRSRSRYDRHEDEHNSRRRRYGDD